MKHVWENKPIGFAFSDLVSPRKVQGQWKWYKMVEVNGAYKHGLYEKNWLDS